MRHKPVGAIHELPAKISKKRIDVIEIYLSKDGRTQKINHIKDWEKQL